MKSKKFCFSLRRLALAFSVSVLPVAALAQTFSVNAARSAYHPGEAIVWHVSLTGSVQHPEYRLRPGGLDLSDWQPLVLVGGYADLTVNAGDKPGWQLVEVRGTGANGTEVKQFGGALIDPEKIVPASPRPADFDAFWAAKLAELNRVPMHAVVTPGESGRPGIEYDLVRMDNIRGSHIEAQLARPREGKKFPALLILQWAGVYGLQKDWVLKRAEQGWLTLNVNPHDLPIGMPDAFYKAQDKGPLADYPHIGNEDRETNYFLRMYLSCYRAAEYLASRPDWDGKTLVVMGASQGGMQTLFTAAMSPRVTAALAEVPAGGDQWGPDVGRLAGWPCQLSQAWDRDLQKVREACLYFDSNHFAPRIHCPILIGVGLIDTVVPPPGVYASFNQIKAPKRIVAMPGADHQQHHQEYVEISEAWLQALRQGGVPPPVPAEPAVGR